MLQRQQPLRLRPYHCAAFFCSRFLSSQASSSSSSTPSAVISTSSSESHESSESVAEGRKRGFGNLERRLLNLKYSRHSAVVTITKWVGEGNALHKKQLYLAVRQLRGAKRYKHALELCEWAATQADFGLQPGDYAVHLDLVAKVRGLTSAEKFFDDLPMHMQNQSTYTSLLHVYVQNNMIVKAESIMDKMTSCRLLTSCLPYNHMINLYVTNGMLDKVPKIMEELEKNTEPNVVTYNILLAACSTRADLKGAEKFFVEMREKKISPDWITYSTLAKVYIDSGMPGKARRSLKQMEGVVSKEERKAYISLLTLHANLSDEGDVRRIWGNMKSIFERMSSLEYYSMIACLLKVGDLEGAESIYSEWESISGIQEMRIPNLLVSGYTRKGMMDKAENFIEHLEGKGIRLNYSTWEAMALGYLEQDKMDDVLRCLWKAFSSLKKWQTNEKIVKVVLEKVEKLGDIETAEEFLRMLRKAGHVTTPIYNSLLRTYQKAGKMPLIVMERMKKDNVKPDDETEKLLESIGNLSLRKTFSLVS